MRRKPQQTAGGFRAGSSVGWMGGATDGPRIGSSEQLAKGSIRQSRDSLRRLPPEVSGLQQFHSLVSPATFPPTECLMAPASYYPRVVRCGVSTARGPRSPFVMPSLGDWVLFRRRVPLLLSTGPGTVETVVGPSA